VERLTLEQLADSPAFETAVQETQGIAQYCSGIDWGLAATLSFHPNQTPFVVHSDDSWVVLTQGTHSQLGTVLQPLEAVWGFNSPLIGRDLGDLVLLLEHVLISNPTEWNALCLSGLPKHFAQAVFDALESRFRVLCRPGIRVNRAHIHTDEDDYISRRPQAFRTNLRRDRRRCEASGIHFEHQIPTGGVEGLMKRLHAIERLSRKREQGESILKAPLFSSFYRALFERASERNALHVVFAKMDGQDLAYAIGGVLGMEYRGFQMSYKDEYRALGVGNVTQLAMMEQLRRRGVLRYDLGMEMAYKERWGDEILSLHTVVAFNTQ
jgi:hypothetical protein